ncbi:hypothetical protein TrST_g5190 [Triparma strigata]|uniref:C2H2-type domain-containing protein n=1 Tax=Triparma strigata TaxID=1606541 RepID=A0A9W7BU21_9STRA|nr:hypothetical protein TrST_g5190 [Triparma strigata]
MSDNDSVSLNHLTPVSNVVSSPRGVGAMDTLTNGGVVSEVVYQKLLFGTDDANATPITVYGDDSTVAEDDLDDGSVIFAASYTRKVESKRVGKGTTPSRGLGPSKTGLTTGTAFISTGASDPLAPVNRGHTTTSCGETGGGLVRDKRGYIIRMCGTAGCQYKTSKTTNMKNHKAAKHGIDVVWFSCDQEGCDYKAKAASNLKQHKASVHDIDVRWHRCNQVGCDYKAKATGTLKRHKQLVHDIDVRWHHCDQDGCDFKTKQAVNLKQHKQDAHDIDLRWHRCDHDGCSYKAKVASNLKRHKRSIHSA